MAPQASVAAEGALDEIVVTARKREERLTEVPISVSAFTGTQLEESGTTDLGDLARMAPGMTFYNGGTRTYGQLLFRGMSNAALLDTTLENASVFVDGVYYIGSTAALNFDDVERIEVVRGPQSAFFGRATFSGAINVVTRAPSSDFAGRVSLQGAQFDDYQAMASLEGPLGTPALTGRLSVKYRDFGGMYTNSLTGDNLGETTDRSVSGVLNFEPVESLSVRLRGYYLDQEDGPNASILYAGMPQANCGPFGGVNNGGFNRLFCGTVDFDSESYPLNTEVPALTGRTLGVDQQGLERTYRSGTVNADWRLGGYTLSSLTGYGKEKLQYLGDGDSSGIDNWYNFQNREQKGLSEELRFTSPQDGRVRWLAGLYYLKQDYFFISNFIYGADNPLVRAGTFTNGFVSPASANRKTIKNTAAFGSVGISLTDTLALSLEGRYQRDRVNASAPGLPAGRIELETKAFLPRVILDFKPAPGTLFYASFARGNKPTQPNPDIAGIAADRQATLDSTYGIKVVTPEEKLTSYEVGTKLDLADGRAYVGASVFFMDWKDRQSRAVFTYDFNGNGRIDTTLTGVNRENFNSIVFRAGNADVRGFELEGRWAATPALSLAASASYAKTEYSELQDAIFFNYFGTRDASARREPRVPRWTATAAAEYRRPLAGDLEGTLAADVTAVDSKYEYYFNLAETGTQTRVNTRASLGRGAWSFTVFALNLFDDRTPDTIDSGADLAYDPLTFRARSIVISPPQRRQIGARVDVRF
jgi:iron complex outermembrane receptor protein